MNWIKQLTDSLVVAIKSWLESRRAKKEEAKRYEAKRKTDNYFDKYSGDSDLD